MRGLLIRLLILVAALLPLGARAADQTVMWLHAHGDEPQQALLLETDVTIEVNGLIARSEVRQRFFNATVDWAEGRYVFPLPDNAAVDRLWIRVGERLIEGEIQERRQAQQTYREAREAGRHAGLVEQERPNLFTASVANIPPGEEIEIRIGFQQEVKFEEGRFSLHFPTAMVPRFIPGHPLPHGGDEHGGGWAPDTDRVPDASRITPPVQHPAAGPVNPLRLTALLDPGFEVGEVEASYHDITVVPDGRRLRVQLAGGSTVSDRDFELVWRPADTDRVSSAMFTQHHDGSDYALVMLIPPHEFSSRQTPREVILIIDTSGSMRGDPLEQARASLHFALDSLSHSDRFNVIEFNHLTRELYAAPVPVDAGRLDDARRFVDNLRAGGGTVMGPSLEQAMRGSPPPGFLRQIVFITDGVIGNEDEVLQQIRRDIGDSRLFNVGIGHGVNSHFLRRGAEYGRGSYTFIADLVQIEARMSELVRRLTSPVLHDIALHWPGFAEVYPERLPDLYTGEPLLFAARTEALAGELMISGSSDGRPWQASLSLDFNDSADGIAQAWARRRLDALHGSLLDGADADVIRAMTIETAVTYQLLSPHTSLVAVDRTPARSQAEALARHQVPGNLPHGRQLNGFFAGVSTRPMPATATESGLNLLRGLLALTLIALMLFGGRMRGDDMGRE